jgi:hypothetical protein
MTDRRLWFEAFASGGATDRRRKKGGQYSGGLRQDHEERDEWKLHAGAPSDGD